MNPFIVRNLGDHSHKSKGGYLSDFDCVYFQKPRTIQISQKDDTFLILETSNTRNQTQDTRQQTSDNRQQTANSKQQQQTEDKRQQAAHRTQQTAVISHQSPDTRHQTPDTRHQSFFDNFFHVG